MFKNWISIMIVTSLLVIVVANIIGNDKESANDKKTAQTTETANKTETKDTDEQQNVSSQVEYAAPDFELKTISGKIVRLSDYAGKKVLLNFWATWCPPCNEEAPHMQKVYEEFQNQGFEILAVNVTSQDKGKDAVSQFVKQYGLTFNVLLDEEGIVASEYQILTLPTSYMLDAKGNIVKAIEGPMDEAVMRELISKAEN